MIVRNPLLPWTVKCKFTSDTLGADNIDILIMCLDDFFGNRKSESGSLFVFATGAVRLVKTNPYTVQGILRNTTSLILHRYKNFIMFSDNVT